MEIAEILPHAFGIRIGGDVFAVRFGLILEPAERTIDSPGLTVDCPLC